LWLATIPVGILGLGEIPLLLRVNDTQRSLQSLTIIIAIGFGMLSLQLLRNQVIWSQYLADRVVVNQSTGETSSNVRTLMLTARTFRGAIRDRNNTILTDTVVGADGRTARRYPTDEIQRLYTGVWASAMLHGTGVSLVWKQVMPIV
jgi:peptidoglycan glycosyltransferase